MSLIHTTAAQLADLCVSKNAAYGDSVGKSAQALAILYPDGLRPEQYLDAILAARDFDKRSRLAQGADLHGEDPRLDIAGYALMAVIHQVRKVAATCASASAPDAEQGSSLIPSASAPLNAPGPTTPPASAETASSTSKTSSLSSASSSAPVEAATAPTATAAAPSPSAVPADSQHLALAGDAPSLLDVLADARKLRQTGRCNFDRCHEVLPFLSDVVEGERFLFGTQECRRKFHLLVQSATREAA